MKKFRLMALALLLTGTSTLTSCATMHLWHWGLGSESFVDEPATDFSASMLKPSVTVMASPITLAWDAVTLPYQLIFQVYPFFGQKHMHPAEVSDN